jgi:hypothetical protein
VGEDGFDLDTGDDEDDDEYGDEDDDDADDDDDDVVGEKREDEQKITDAIMSAYGALASHGVLPEWDRAVEQLVAANDLGEDGRTPAHETSLPSSWAGLFRPLANGTRGIDLMRKRLRRDPAFAALAETRAVLFEVLSVLGSVGTCRDVMTGEILRVRLGSVATKSTRWMRFFAYLTPMEDGTLYPPSTMLGHVWLRNVSVEAWLAKLNGLLEELGVDERVDPAKPTPALTRWGALADSVLHGMIAPTPEERDEQGRPLFVVDSDGERVEFHEATIPLAPDVERRLVEALARADDFVARDGFAWMRRPKEREAVAGEHVAFVEPPRNGSIRVTTTSVPRFRALCDRLEALAGSKLVPSRVDVLRPWEKMAGAVAIETAESRRVVFGSSQVSAGEVDVERVVVDGLRRSLDEEVPMLGGRPRDLVADEDGRRRVERWLQDQELRGMPSGNAFLDLDVVRRELGLPGVFPLGGRVAVHVPDRKISETILEFAQPILAPLGETLELAAARRALDLAVGVWNFHAMATPLWGRPQHLAEARAKMRGAGPETSAIFESLLARRADLYGDDPRVVSEWHLGPDGRGGHSFRCDARLPEGRAG